MSAELDARAGVMTVEQARQRNDEALGPVTPLRRSGAPEEVAEAIGPLAFAQWTTGAILDVDGGLGLGTLSM